MRILTTVLLIYVGFAFAFIPSAITYGGPINQQGQASLTYRVHREAVLMHSAVDNKEVIIADHLPFGVEDNAPVLVLAGNGSTEEPLNHSHSTMLVGVEGGVYCSPDGGSRWFRALTAGPMTPQRFEVHEATHGHTQSIYLVASLERGGSAVWLSRDRGMFWHKEGVFAKQAEQVNIQGLITEKKALVENTARQPEKTQSLPFDITWSDPIILSDTAWKDSYAPQIALSGEDTIHVCWFGGPAENLPYCRSTNGGISFAPEMDAFPGDTVGSHPQITTNHNTVCIIFCNGTSPWVTEERFHLIKSTDYGATWPTRRLINEENAGQVVQVCSSGDSIVALESPYYITDGDRIWRPFISTDNGESWTMRPEGFHIVARVSLAPRALHMITNGYRYAHTDAIEALYIRSTNLGQSWKDTLLLSSNDGWFSDVPMISSFTTSSGLDQAWAVWRDVKYGGVFPVGGALLSRTQLPGNKWTDEVILTGPVPNGAEARLAANKRLRAMSCLLEFTDYWHAGIAWTVDGITSFSPMEDITPDNEIGSAPAIAISDSTVHVVWEQVFPSEWGHAYDKFHIMYRKGTIHMHNAAGEANVPDSVVLDSTGIYKTASKSFSIRYQGADTLYVPSIVSDNPHFILDPPSGMITPGQDSLRITVTYQNTVATNETAHVYIYDNSPISPKVVTVMARTGWEQCTVQYSEARSWQLVSLPIQTIKPLPLRQLFGFVQGHYQSEDSLRPTHGYWAKPDSTALLFEGTRFQNLYGAQYDTIHVAKGWNLIATASTETVPVGDLSFIPSDNQRSAFYGYTRSGYTAAVVLEPGRAYFVKMNADGAFVVGH